MFSRRCPRPIFPVVARRKRKSNVPKISQCLCNVLVFDTLSVGKLSEFIPGRTVCVSHCLCLEVSAQGFPLVTPSLPFLTISHRSVEFSTSLFFHYLWMLNSEIGVCIYIFVHSKLYLKKQKKRL